MRSLFLHIIILTILLAMPHGTKAQGLLYELRQLYRIDQLPQYLNSGTVEQISSYDRTGGNDDGFAGTYSFIRMEGTQQVIADIQGPGVINRIWTPTPTSDTIAFYFDGEEKPGLILPFDKLFVGNRFPFLEPICGSEVGGYYCYLPIPYNKSCRVVFKGKMLFYQIQYRTYPQKTKIKTYSNEWTKEEKEALQDAVDFWKGYGNNFLDELYSQVSMETRTIKIASGETISLFEMKEGGRIVGIETEGLDKLDRNDNSLLLKANWDNEESNAIEVPLKDLFGFFFGDKSMQSLLVGTAGSKSYFYYPMPFSKSAHLELTYLEGRANTLETTELTYKIYYTKKALQNYEGKFYVQWNRISNPVAGQPYPILNNFKGKGHYVGTILSCQGLLSGTTNYFEGDDQATIDGNLCIHGTGSEDYFNGGWYLIPDRWDMAYSLPSHGCLDYCNALSRTGGYRHYFNDKLNFEKDFSLNIEHGPEGNSFPVDYRSVAFFYADHPHPGTVPTADLTAYPKPPSIKYQGYLLNILAFRNGGLINGEWIGSNLVLSFKPDGGQEPMLVKINLEAPFDGDYNLYASWYRTGSQGEIRFMQRQIVLSGWESITGNEKEYVEREFVGTLVVKDGSGTLTIYLRADENCRFSLHELILEEAPD